MVLARFDQLQQQPFPGMIEAVPAYSTLTIFYDVFALRSLAGQETVYDWMEKRLTQWLLSPVEVERGSSTLKRIPVCYDGADMEAVIHTTGLNADEIISIHCGRKYRVYMLGFLPGFSYMGELDEKLFTKRKPQPSIVEPGSVAITGNQTGIYPLRSPGGWSVIGRTPLTLFSPGSSAPAFLQAGDEVEFFSITVEEFNSIWNEHHNS